MEAQGGKQNRFESTMAQGSTYGRIDTGMHVVRLLFDDCATAFYRFAPRAPDDEASAGGAVHGAAREQRLLEVVAFCLPQTRERRYSKATSGLTR